MATPMRAEGARTTGTKDPVKEAAAILARARTHSLPIDVRALAEAEGAVLELQRFESDISGVVVRRPNARPTIGVNTTHPLTRQRFTIAHELGHLKLHAGEPLIVDKLVVYNVNLRRSSIPNDQVEREANKFAAALLMPQDLVMREVKRQVPKRAPIAFDDLIEKMAKTFGVSPQAMSLRLRELGVLSAFGAS